jgi:hypothetical protein
MSNGSYNLMLDPSMFLTIADDERRLDVMLNRMESLAGEGVALHIPQAFMNFVEDNYLGERDEDGEARWFNIYGGENRHAVRESNWAEALYTRLRDRAELIHLFTPDRDLKEKHAEFAEALDQLMSAQENDGRFLPSLFQSILQEWIFLQEQSWIVAQTDRAFEQMVKAGSVCLKLGKGILGRVVRKTRGKEEDEAITTLDRLLTVGKWVAAGCGAVTAAGLVSIPPALAITIALSPSFFALIDP